MEKESKTETTEESKPEETNYLNLARDICHGTPAEKDEFDHMVEEFNTTTGVPDNTEEKT